MSNSVPKANAGGVWRGPAVLSALALGALGLRLPWIASGLPNSRIEEEWIATFSSLRWWVGPDGVDPVVGGVHQFLLWVASWVLFGVARVQGHVADLDTFSTQMAGDPTGFLTVGRLGAALVGVATVVLLARHVGNGAGTRAGWSAGVFLAVACVHVEMSRSATGEAIQLLFILLCLIVLVEEGAGRRKLPMWGLALLLAATFRAGWPGPLVLLPYWATLQPLDRRTLGAVVVAGLLAAIPGSLGLFGDATWGGFAAPGVASTLEGARSLAVYWWITQGPGIGLLALIGIAVALTRKHRVAEAHLLFALSVLVAAAFRAPGESGASVLIPTACLLAGIGLDELAGRLRPFGRAAAPVAVLVVVVVSLEPGWASLGSVRDDALPETRSLAAGWLRENVEHRAAVLVPATLEDPWQPAVPIPNLKKSLRQRAAALADVGDPRARYWSYRAESLARPFYDLQLVAAAEAWPSLSEVQASGIAYAILPAGDFVHGDGWASTSESERSRRRFYEDLLNAPAVELMAEFAADDRVRGPNLEIWKVGQVEAAAPGGAAPGDAAPGGGAPGGAGPEDGTAPEVGVAGD